jgi:hypothetical protein
MKTTYKTLTLQALLATVVAWSYATNAMATLVYTNQNSTTNTGAFDASVSGTDLINSLQSTFLSASHSGWFGGSGPALNDGSAGTGFGAPGSAYGQYASNPSTTFNLNISVNTLGYDITEIHSFAGYTGGFERNYGNQQYNIEYQYVNGTWTSPVTVSYLPFPFNGSVGDSASFVNMTDSGGTIVSGVKAVKISILKPDPNAWDGIIMKEFDVIGTPTVVPEPGSFAMLLFGSVLLWTIGRKRAV